MFDDFISQGSVFAVVLMGYGGNVIMEALRRHRSDPMSLHTPPIIKHPLSALLMIGAVPCAFWPAIYIGLYSGWSAGLISWIVLPLFGAVLLVPLGIRGNALGVHFILACIAYPLGYYLSISNIVA